MPAAKYSKFALGICMLLIWYMAFVFYPKWQKDGTESSMGWDAATYYWYLPATFIYIDLKQQKFGDNIIQQYKLTPSFSQSFVHESGNRVITYSSGVAVVQIPAFFAAHLLAKPLGYAADGFSKPYQVAIQLWSVLIGLAGLWFFRKLLLLYYSDKTAAIVLLMLTAGTCYLNYAAIDATITHSILFTIYTLLLLNTHNYYLHRQRRYAIRIGLLCGLAILVRPSEMIAVLLPLLWGMEGISTAALKKQFSFYRNNAVHLLLAALCLVSVCLVQVGYWYYVTGQPIVYSYDDKTFSWLAPHTWAYLTSSTSGWVMYNPMVLFIFLGIPAFIKYGRNKVAILTFFVLNLYIISAWDVWWYSGIGGRAMVQSYGITMLIAATFIEWILLKRRRVYIAMPFLLLFAYVSLWVHYHAHRSTNLYDPVFMSKQYYWAVIGRWTADREQIKLQDARNIYRGKLADSVLVYENGFEDTDGQTETVVSGAKSLLIKGRTKSDLYVVRNLPANKEWIRLQCTYRGFELEWDYWSMFRTRLHFKHGTTEVKGEDYRPQRFLWDYGERVVYYDVLVPEKAFDRIEISFLNENSDKPMVVDDIKVWAYNGE